MSLDAEPIEQRLNSDSFDPGDPQEDRKSGLIPGEVGVWVFILGDLAMFTLLFGVFLFYRAENPPIFISAQENLRQDLALANTVLLLSSSWLVVRGLAAFRSRQGRAYQRFFIGAILCGLGFVALKYVEYEEKFAGGITINTNDFYTYYFILTGIHLIHLVVGIAILFFLTRIGARPDPTPTDHRMVESGCLYWHMVDLLWIVILAIIYLV